MPENNNLLMIVAIVAIVVAVVNLGITINKVGDIMAITGFATDTGTANLTIESAASVSFVTSVINWGSGQVDEASTSATIDSEGTMTNGLNWTTVSQGLTLQNDGNCNVTFTLTTSNVASAFIGGSAVTPTYKIKVTTNETNACGGTNSLSSYTEATGAAQPACNNTGYSNTADAVDIDVQLVIPEDALPGAKSSVITATASCI